MSLRFLKSLFARPSSRTHGRRPPTRLAVEALGDRSLPSAAFAQSLGTPGDDGGFSVGTDAAGDVYTAGYVHSPTGGPGSSVLVAKYDTNGLPLWKQQAGNSSFDRATAIAVDAKGFSYVTGTFGGTLALGGITLTAKGPLDGFVEEIAPNGAVVWARQFANDNNFGSGPADKYGTLGPSVITLDHAGNVIVDGFFSGSLDLDSVNPGVHVLHSTAPGGNPDVFVVKLNGAGGYQWSAQARDVDGVNVYGVTVDGQNNVYSLGAYQHIARFVDAAGHVTGLSDSNVVNDTLYIWKLTPGGTTVWARTIADSQLSVGLRGLGLAADPTALYATGSYDGSAVKFGGVLVPPSAGNSPDVFVEKLDLNGNRVWWTHAAGAGKDEGTGVALDTAGNPYVTGTITAPTWFGNQLLAGGAGGTSFVTRLDRTTGQFVQSKAADVLPGSGDRSYGIAVDSQGYVDFTGRFTNQFHFPGLPGRTSVGGTDLDVVKVGLTTPTTKIQLLGDRLLIDGTDLPDKLVVKDDRHWGVSVTVGDDVPRVYQGVHRIEVMTGGGDDVFTYSSAGPTGLGGPDTGPAALAVDLGAGNDAADFTVGGREPPPIPWRATVIGGAGNDTIRVNCAFDPSDLRVGGPISIGVDGGAGNDTIRFSLLPAGGARPVLAGPLTVRLDGGAGNDVVRADVALDPRSTGRLDVRLDGGSGNDDLTYNGPTSLPPGSATLIDGGEGIDLAHHTGAVRVVNCER